MDNKITKGRFSDFLSYEWILMIVISIAAIIVWEFAYTVGAVRLTVGQEFKYYFDESISSATSNDFYELVAKDTFSYDVIELDYEALMSDYNVLSVRLSIQEGDVLVTDCKEPEEGATGSAALVRAKSAVDNYEYHIYCLDTLLSDAKEYLRQFLKDGVAGEDAELTYSNLDEGKIDAVFRERMKKDNRFRKKMATGYELERERIERLTKEVSDFQKFLNTAPEEAFFRYTKYEQSLTYADNDTDKTSYQNAMQKEIDEKRENARYGINAAGLKGGEGKHNPSEFFKMKDSDTAENVVLMAFNFKEYQPHLQYEVISFYNTVIRACSNYI